MAVVFLIISATTMVLQNCFFNSFSKSAPRSGKEITYFNSISYAVCILLFGVLTLVQQSISIFTVITGFIFGFLTANSHTYRMKALSKGPMNITLIITTSSMIIPTMSGVFFGEGFSILKLCGVFVLLFFIYLSLGTGKGSGFDKSWFLFSLLAFFCQGFIGVMQKIHQTSQYKEETGGFLLMAFVFSVIYNLIVIGKNAKTIKLETKYSVFSFACGFFVFAMNYLNLVLSGMLPSQLMFPLVNGSSIIISTLISVFLFKETLTKKQLIGVCGGIASLIAICLLP